MRLVAGGRVPVQSKQKKFARAVRPSNARQFRPSGPPRQAGRGAPCGTYLSVRKSRRRRPFFASVLRNLKTRVNLSPAAATNGYRNVQPLSTNPWRTTMSRKLILTLATAATIAASALASTAADARGFGGGGGGFGGGHGGFGGGLGASAALPRRRRFRRRPHRRRRPRRPDLGLATSPATVSAISGTGSAGRTGTPHHHWFWRDGRWVYGDGYWTADYAQPVAADSAPAVSTPGPCTCLTKSYTQDGMVVFADLCTKESAAAPVDGRSADATPPQGPPGRRPLRPLRPRTRRAMRLRCRTRRTSPAAPTRTSWRRTVCRCRKASEIGTERAHPTSQGRPRDHRGRLFVRRVVGAKARMAKRSRLNISPSAAD